MKKQQKWAWFFTVVFLLVVFVTNFPAFTDAQGYNFGLFKIDPIDNVVHTLTFIIGALCAWWGAATASWFLLLGGALYGFDAAAGMFAQRGVLDMSLFTQPSLGPNFGLTNFLINGPHIIIAAIMIWLGWKGLKLLKTR